MRRAPFAAVSIALMVSFALPATSADAQRRRQRQPQQQEGPSAEAREAARQAYARGQESFRTGDYDAAIASFQEAYEAVPNPVVLLGLAEAQERKGDIPGTIETLERYLAERADAPDRAQIEGRLTDLRARPAVVVIASTPAGATISVDGETRTEVTPAEIEVPPGEHVIAVTLAGHDPASQTVEATVGGRHEIELTLEAAPAGPIEDPFGDTGEPAEPPVEPPVVDEPDEGLSTGVWVAAGVAGAALVGGTVLGFLALSEQSDYDAMPTEESADRGERLALFADVAFGVAAIAGVTAIVLYVTSDGGGGDDESPDVASIDVTPVVGPEGGGLAAQVTF